jgi:hypothetical protein
VEYRSNQNRYIYILKNIFNIQNWEDSELGEEENNKCFKENEYINNDSIDNSVDKLIDLLNQKKTIQNYKLVSYILILILIGIFLLIHYNKKLKIISEEIKRYEKNIKNDFEKN